MDRAELEALEARIEERRAQRRALAAMDRKALENLVLKRDDQWAEAMATVVGMAMKISATHRRMSLEDLEDMLKLEAEQAVAMVGRPPTADPDAVRARIAELGGPTKRTKGKVAEEAGIGMRRVEQILATSAARWYRLGIIDPAVARYFRGLPKKVISPIPLDPRLNVDASTDTCNRQGASSVSRTQSCTTGQNKRKDQSRFR